MCKELITLYTWVLKYHNVIGEVREDRYYYYIYLQSSYNWTWALKKNREHT